MNLILLAVLAGAAPEDPLRSPLWPSMVERFLPGAVVFDPRVEVIAPAAAEDPLAVPIRVRVRGLGSVRKIRVLADLNPLPLALDLEPTKAHPDIGFRLKVERSTPVRAAVLTEEGWRVGGIWLAAAGGGCSAPSAASAAPQWYERLGEVYARRWPQKDGQRVKLRVMHPMDTGLAPGVPVFHIEHIELRGEAGDLWARIHPYEPVEENPTFTLDLTESGPFRVEGRDLQANRFSARVGP